MDDAGRFGLFSAGGPLLHHSRDPRIKKADAAGPPECPRCTGPMEVIAFVEQWSVIKKITADPGRWEVKRRLP